MKLSGMVAVVTGAGRGIGRSIALKFAEEGADIVINYSKSGEEAEETAETIRFMGRKALLIRADVSNPFQVRSMVEKTIKEMGKVDVLVNNAGILVPGSLVELSNEDWDRVVRVNLNGVFYCLREFGKHMVKRRKGVIINIASTAGIIPLIGCGAYSSTKAAVIMLTKQAALEWAEHGVRVNAICPGPIKTQMTLSRYTPDKLEKRNRLTPMGRMGEPEEVARLAVFLASAESSYITGETITIDGGLTSSPYWIIKQVINQI